MAATQLAEQIANQYLTQGQILGQNQREYQKFPIAMSLEDLQRQLNEEQAYSSQVGSLLSNNPPQYYNEPNLWSQLGGAAQDIGTTLMMSNILGGGLSSGGAASGGGGLIGSMGPQNANLYQKMQLLGMLQ